MIKRVEPINSMDKLEVIKTKIAEIVKSYDISKVYLFGSCARGTDNENSDIDFFVVPNKNLSLLKQSSLLVNCKEKFNKDVDIVVDDGSEDNFIKNINKDKILVYG